MNSENNFKNIPLKTYLLTAVHYTVFFLTLYFIISTCFKVLFDASFSFANSIFLILAIGLSALSQYNKRTTLYTIIFSVITIPLLTGSIAFVLLEKHFGPADFIVNITTGLFRIFTGSRDVNNTAFFIAIIFYVWLSHALAMKLKAVSLYLLLGSATFLLAYFWAAQGQIEVYILKQGLYFLAFFLPLAASVASGYIPKKTSTKSTYIKLYAIVAAFMCAIFLTNSIFMPKSDEQYVSSTLSKLFSKNFIESSFDLKDGYDKIFKLSSGFKKQESTKLGGDIVLDRSLKLKVTCSSVTYLRGAVFDYYAGNSWSSKEERKFYTDPTAPSSLPDFQDVFGLNEPTFKNLLGSSFEMQEVFITKTNNWDTSLFNSMRTYKYTLNGLDAGNVKFTNVGEVFYTKQIDSQYSFSYYKPKETYINYISTVKSENTSQVSSAYRQLPANIDPRVRTLLDGIVKVGSTPYQNAKAIDVFLRNNYKYTLQPGEVPAGKDFVSYFLLENKQGYCEYYASAFVVLCRMAGIPARLVEGYKVDKISQVGADGYLEPVDVTGANAHAWAEIYIDGCGWETFDAVSQQNFASNSIIVTASPDDSPTLPPTGEPKPTPIPTPSPLPTVTPTPTPAPTPSPTPSAPPSKFMMALGYTSIAFAIALVLALLAMVLLRMKKRYTLQYLHLTNTDQFDELNANALYKEIEWLLAKLRIDREGNQTIYWYFRESGKTLAELAQKLYKKKYLDMNEADIARKAALSANFMLFSQSFDGKHFDYLREYYKLLVKLSEKKYSKLLLSVLWNLRKN